MLATIVLLILLLVSLYIILKTNIESEPVIDNKRIPSCLLYKQLIVPGQLDWDVEVIEDFSVCSPKMDENYNRDIDIIYCGRFEDQKNLIRLLRISKLLVKRKSNLKVLIIGSGRQELLLKKYVTEHKLNQNVSFMKPINNVDDYLCRAKIFALTSKFEGQPMALLEAMSCGCVPILSNFPGSDEYIIHNFNGLIAKTDFDFSKNVLRCLKNKELRIKLTQAAKQTVKRKYSEKNIQKYIDLLIA